MLQWLQTWQFVNRPPFYKLITQFLNWLAHFQLYKGKWSRLETRPNGFKDGQTALKLAEWFYKQPKQHESLPNYSQKYTITSKVVSQARLSNQCQRTMDQILKAIHAGSLVSLVSDWYWSLTEKLRNHPSFLLVFNNFFPVAFICTRACCPQAQGE